MKIMVDLQLIKTELASVIITWKELGGVILGDIVASLHDWLQIVEQLNTLSQKEY